MTTVTDAGDPDLAREALEGLFSIAQGDPPAGLRESLEAQISELSEAECRRLVEQMVDTDRLKSLLEADSEPSRLEASIEAGPARDVDRALDPLVRWAGGEEARSRLKEMPEAERVHLLFSSLGPQ